MVALTMPLQLSLMMMCWKVVYVSCLESSPLGACLLNHHKAADQLEMHQRRGARCPALTAVAQRTKVALRRV